MLLLLLENHTSKCSYLILLVWAPQHIILLSMKHASCQEGRGWVDRVDVVLMLCMCGRSATLRTYVLTQPGSCLLSQVCYLEVRMVHSPPHPKNEYDRETRLRLCRCWLMLLPSRLLAIGYWLLLPLHYLSTISPRR